MDRAHLRLADLIGKVFGVDGMRVGRHEKVVRDAELAETGEPFLEQVLPIAQLIGWRTSNSPVNCLIGLLLSLSRKSRPFFPRRTFESYLSSEGDAGSNRSSGTADRKRVPDRRLIAAGWLGLLAKLLRPFLLELDLVDHLVPLRPRGEVRSACRSFDVDDDALRLVVHLVSALPYGEAVVDVLVIGGAVTLVEAARFR